MPPKSPKELNEQIEQAQDEPADPGHERTAEGLEVPTPGRGEFFENLTKVTNPDK